MKHSMALDYLVWVVQKMLGVDVSEIAFPGSDYYRSYVYAHLIDQSCS